jgi:hypothetical protein
VQAPAPQIPTQEQFFAASDPTKPDIAFLKNHFYREGRLSEEQALFIIEKANDILRSEPNMLALDGPVTSVSPFRFIFGSSAANCRPCVQSVATSTANMCVFFSCPRWTQTDLLAVRFDEAVRDWWQPRRHALPFPGRLCG